MRKNFKGRTWVEGIDVSLRREIVRVSGRSVCWKSRRILWMMACRSVMGGEERGVGTLGCAVSGGVSSESESQVPVIFMSGCAESIMLVSLR